MSPFLTLLGGIVLEGVMRPSLDEWFMELATVTAKRGTCLRKQVGCVLARGNRLLSLGYVGSPQGEPHCTEVGCSIGLFGGCERTTHAEVNSLLWATRLGVDVDGATAYTTLSPCRYCAEALFEAGIERVVYSEEYRLTEPIEWLRSMGVECGQL